MSGSPAYLPLFGSDYLADTTHLSTEEHGAYLLLMIAAWRQDDCGLPMDDRKLARIVGLSLRKWSQIKEVILEFWTIENGRIYQPRLQKEWGYACKKSESNRENARKRWSEQVTENIESTPCDRISDGNAPQPQPHIEEEPNGSPSKAARRKSRADGTNERSQDINPRKTGESPRAASGSPPAVPEWLPLEQWEAFLEMRRKKRAVSTGRALSLIFAKLDRLRTSGHDPGAVLDQSTLKNWTDIYPLKDDENGNSNRQAHGLAAAGNRDAFDRRDGFQRSLDERIANAGSRGPAEAAGRYGAGDGAGGGELPASGRAGLL